MLRSERRRIKKIAGKISFFFYPAISTNENKIQKKTAEEEITTNYITLAVVRQNGEGYFTDVGRKERKEKGVLFSTVTTYRLFGPCRP